MISTQVVENIEDIYELTDFQAKIISEYKNAPGEGMHLMNLIFNYEGKLKEDIFRKCWERIIDKYTCFRTSFFSIGLDKPLQAVQSNIPFSYNIIDFQELNRTDQEKELQRLVQEDKKKDFKLEKAPLMRIDIIIQDDNLFKIWWRFPEMLMDGWNIPIVIKDFLQFYRSFHVENSPLNDEKVYAYRDYVAWLNMRDVSKEAQFWQRYMKDYVPVKQNTLGKSTDSTQTGNTDRIDLNIADLYEDLSIYAKTNEITLNSIFQGVFFLIMDRIISDGNLDLVIGTTVADRPLALKNAQQRVGLYLNTLPIRCSCDESMAFNTMARRFHSEMMELFEFTSSSEKEIKNWCGITNDQPLFNCMIIFENMPVNEENYDGIGFKLIDYNFENRPPTSLNFFVWPGKDMNLKMIYDTRIYSANKINTILSDIRNTIQSIVSQSNDITIKSLLDAGASE